MTKELIAKLEALEAPDAEVFRMVATRCYGFVPAAFNNMLNCEAWESAAIMLKPDELNYGWGYKKHISMSLLITDDGETIEAEANHPAIALLICILKAKEPVE